MDVDKIVKMNKLSKELQKHGMAQSSEDGIMQAEKMVEHNENDRMFGDGSETKEEEIKVSEIKEPERPTRPAEPALQQGLADPNQKSVIELNEFVKNLHSNMEKKVQAIDTLQQKILSLELEMDQLKKNHEKLLQKLEEDNLAAKPVPKQEVQSTITSEHRERPAPARPEPAQSPQPAPQPELRQPEKPKDTTNGSPRSGNYTSEDVSVDKVFYFGNKKD